MHQLILLVSIISIYTLSLLLANQVRDYYFAFNLCIVPIIACGLFLNKISTLLVTAFCCILGLTLALTGASSANIAQSILLFTGCAFLSAVIR